MRAERAEAQSEDEQVASVSSGTAQAELVKVIEAAIQDEPLRLWDGMRRAIVVIQEQFAALSASAVPASVDRADRGGAMESRLRELKREDVEAAWFSTFDKDDWTHIVGFANAVRAIACLRAAVEPPPQDGWQPIETAPKDGTLVLLVKAGDSDWPMRCRRWVDGHWRGQDADNATHWRPLPLAPGVAPKEPTT